MDLRELLFELFRDRFGDCGSGDFVSVTVIGSGDFVSLTVIGSGDFAVSTSA